MCDERENLGASDKPPVAESICAMKTPEEVTAFLDERDISAEEFAYAVRMLREDAGTEDSELSDGELREVAGGINPDYYGKDSKIMLTLDHFSEWASSWFD